MPLKTFTHTPAAVVAVLAVELHSQTWPDYLLSFVAGIGFVHCRRAGLLAEQRWQYM
jgi:hypothetical protein